MVFISVRLMEQPEPVLVQELGSVQELGLNQEQPNQGD